MSSPSVIHNLFMAYSSLTRLLSSSYSLEGRFFLNKKDTKPRIRTYLSYEKKVYELKKNVEYLLITLWFSALNLL